MRHPPTRSSIAALALALVACQGLPASNLEPDTAIEASGPASDAGTCESPKVPLSTLPSGICMAIDPGFYWDGSRCVPLPFNKCFVGTLGEQHPEIFPTMRACEVSHAHCR